MPQSGTVYIGSKKTPGEGVKDSLSPEKESKEVEINRLIQRANLIVFEATAQMPILLPFKNKVTICPNRVTITYSSMLSKDEYPMPIENVTGARVYRDLMFGTLHIDTFGLEKPEPLKYLRINDARLARRYILALIECQKAKIELPYDDLDKLREKLKDIGMVRYTTEVKQYHEI